MYIFLQERIYSIIEKNLKSIGNIVQKRNKGNNLRFQVLPLRDNSNQSKNDSNSGESNDQKGPLWLAMFLVVIVIGKYIVLSKYYSKKYEKTVKSDIK